MISGSQKTWFAIAGVTLVVGGLYAYISGKQSNKGTGTGTETDPYYAVETRNPDDVYRQSGYGQSTQGGSRRKRKNKNKKNKKSKKRC